MKGKVYAIHESTRMALEGIVNALESALTVHRDTPYGTMTMDEEKEVLTVLEKAEGFLGWARSGRADGYICRQIRLFRDKYEYLAMQRA